MDDAKDQEAPMREVRSVTQSPINSRRWYLDFDCHGAWITAKKKPTRKRMRCQICAMPKPQGGAVMAQLETVRLDDDELLLLDGRCRDVVQATVDIVKSRLAMTQEFECRPEIAQLAVEAVAAAKEDGHLAFLYERISHCKVCSKSAGYGKYKRSSQYRRAGETNHAKPLYMSGIELRHSFIKFQGTVRLGCCCACFDEAQPHLARALEGVAAQIPEKITGQPPKFLRYDNRHCTDCGWDGHDGALLPLPSIMGGTYPGKCPNCGTENRLLGKILIEKSPGFTLVEMEVSTEVQR